MSGKRINMTRGMLDVIGDAVGCVEAFGEDHEIPSSLTEEQKEKFWREVDRVNAWLSQEYAKRS